MVSPNTPVCTHLSLIMVCNSRIWSFKGSSFSCGPMLSWLTGQLLESLGSEFDKTAGLLLANRTCFIGCSWPVLILFICWLWHGILSYLLRSFHKIAKTVAWPGDPLTDARCLTKEKTCSSLCTDSCFKVKISDSHCCRAASNH